MRYDNEKRKQRLEVFKQDLSHPIGIVYHQQKLYYVDAAYESIFVINDMNNPSDVQIIKNNLVMLSSLKVFYERHTEGKNKSYDLVLYRRVLKEGGDMEFNMAVMIDSHTKRLSVHLWRKPEFQ